MNLNKETMKNIIMIIMIILVIASLFIGQELGKEKERWRCNETNKQIYNQENPLNNQIIGNFTLPIKQKPT